MNKLKKDVNSACEGKISTESFGYIDPGHGNRGKQQWLMSNDDLKDMYADHKDKKDILLWSSVVPDSQKKRAHSPDPEENDKRARYDKYLDKMTEVEMIEAELAEKHSGGSFTDEQLRSWAHLIQMKKWGSYDTPPKKRFFRIPQRSGSSSEVSGSTAGVDGVSPGKKINLRGQCVQQLLQLHQLLEKGGINKQQYDDMQSTIMGDVKKFE